MTISRDALGLPAVYRGPDSELEMTLCRCLSEALRLDRVGLDDDFFDLGGDSLGAERLLLLWRDTGLPEFPITKLISLGTPARLAAWLEERSGQETSDNTPSTSLATSQTAGLTM